MCAAVCGLIHLMKVSVLISTLSTSMHDGLFDQLVNLILWNMPSPKNDRRWRTFILTFKARTYFKWASIESLNA